MVLALSALDAYRNPQRLFGAKPHGHNHGFGNFQMQQ